MPKANNSPAIDHVTAKSMLAGSTDLNNKTSIPRSDGRRKSSAEVKRAALLERDLANAIAKSEIQMYYQAQVNSQGIVTGAEVLMRWLHNKLGFISPVEFIPLAEKNGEIQNLGIFALTEACKQLTKWSKMPNLADLTLAVNVSMSQFQDQSFLGKVIEVLTRTNADAKKLKLEITESIAINDKALTHNNMKFLQANGIRFSLDDYGTGCASLDWVVSLPFDQIKIDQSFVGKMLSDKKSAIAIRNTIQLGQELELDVIAEGVENRSECDYLNNAGCMHYQGYLFSRPLPSIGFEEYAKDKRGI